MLPIYDDVSAGRITTFCIITSHVVSDVSSMFSATLLPVRERIRHEIRTEVSVNGGEGKFGCVMVLTKGPDLCA